MKKLMLAMFNIPNILINKFNLYRKKVQYGKKLKITGRISLHGEGRIIIGDNVTIHSKPTVNPTAGVSRTFLTTKKHGMIKIGNNVGMSKVNITAHSLVIIEDNVLLGDGVKVWDTDFHSMGYSHRVHGDDMPNTSPILIKEGAFVGACSIILKGVTIGKHSIIGAGSVVTKDVLDDEIWAGNPARLVRKITEDADEEYSGNKQL